jgi:hypothetical protein
MAFFKKPTGEEPPPAVAPEPTSYAEPKPAKPVNWEALINAPQEPAAPATPEQPPADAPPPVEKLPEVDEETRKLLDKAAKDLQSKISGNDDGNDK